jgi:hypothetical protein
MTSLRIARGRATFYLILCLGLVRTFLSDSHKALGANRSGQPVASVSASCAGSEIASAELPPSSEEAEMQSCSCASCDSCDGCDACDSCDSCYE